MSTMPMMSAKPRAWTSLGDALRAMRARLGTPFHKDNTFAARDFCPIRKPFSPFVPHGERVKIRFSPQPCLIQWQCPPARAAASVRRARSANSSEWTNDRPLLNPFLVRIDEVNEAFDIVAVRETCLLLPHLEARLHRLVARLR